MNKAIIIQHIVDKLTADLSLYFKAASAARDEATHEQSKAENKYDTRGLEASYLARGQARQVAELEASIQQVRMMTQRAFSANDPSTSEPTWRPSVGASCRPTCWLPGLEARRSPSKGKKSWRSRRSLPWGGS
jgi:hypothetical protein